MRHNVALVGPGARNLVAHGIPDTFGTAGRCESHVVIVAVLIDPGAFLVILDLGVGDDGALSTNHVLVQLDHVQFGVAPVHVGLSVVVNPDGRVDIVPVLALPDQGLVQRFLEGAVRVVGHQDGNAVAVNGDVHEPLAVALDDLFRPGPVSLCAPLDVSQARYGTVAGPVDHVRGSVQQPVVHHEPVGIVFVVGRVQVNRIPMDIGRRVRRIVRRDYNFLSETRTSQGQYGRNE